MLPPIYDQSFTEIVETYCNYFIKEFGERKYVSVVEKLKGSNKINSLIDEAGRKQVMPQHGDLLNRINTIGFFIFSRGQVQVLAAILTLAVWHEKHNEYYQIADEYELKNVSIQIVKESLSTFH